MNINTTINELITYGINNNLIEKLDYVYVANKYIKIFNLDSFQKKAVTCRNIDEILNDLCTYAYENKIIENNYVTTYDLFDTYLMGQIIKMPSVIEKEFYLKYQISPIDATNYFYDLAIKSNYIRKNRIDKNIVYNYQCQYGNLVITINLAKPEKDPREIANQKNIISSTYPKCALCLENLGFYGNQLKPARENLRVIPLLLNNEKWYFQFSPYVYFNEHAIIFKENHSPMAITIETFKRLMDFLDLFPHYFIGSNSDLPIVGGSMLSHDHYQAGRFHFPIEGAGVLEKVTIKKYEMVSVEYLNWPLDTIRLTSPYRNDLIDLADKILHAWVNYEDKSLLIINSFKERHNAITPIARKIGNKYQLDLVLRNNIQTNDYPLGFFHPHSEYHNIKKENIGLIEVMGEAILPGRLKRELKEIETLLINKEISIPSSLEKHANWYKYLLSKYNGEDTAEFIKQEVGIIFEKVLECCSVFQLSNNKVEAFNKFIKTIK